MAERISERLALHYPNLTKRERLVCGFTLAGYTAEGISLILGIGRSTIITYRRRAYSRLGISNVNQMIAPLLAFK
ncbi:helix-turn-helix domain-containing protein [Sphingobium sp.]|uniref:helix-turn-helix domain-containing protein n=1 Tax=Sphingobium sp. TaxID=1912891 RepID=UPI0039B83839